jgi:hypothetical protein
MLLERRLLLERLERLERRLPTRHLPTRQLP